MASGLACRATALLALALFADSARVQRGRSGGSLCSRRGCDSPHEVEEIRIDTFGQEGSYSELRQFWRSFAPGGMFDSLWEQFQPTGEILLTKCGCTPECVEYEICCEDYAEVCGVEAEKKKEPEAGQCGEPDPELAREELQQSLSEIFGLDEVKKAASDLIDEAVLETLMQQHAPPNMQPTNRRQNFAFLGPPGTGKTTIAKMLSKAFCKLGRVKNEAFLVVRPDELIGEYLGQTQKVVKERLEPGLGGVIFIDEAYLISSGGGDSRGPNQYQQEAVGVLMKLLDEHAEDTVFVFAGYSDDMEVFFKSNDGLKRRIPQIFRFAPFSVDDLVSILKLKTMIQGVGLIPDLTEDELEALSSEYAQFAKTSPQLLPAPGTEDVAKGFPAYVKARIGMIEKPEDLLQKKTRSALFKHGYEPPFDQGLSTYEESFFDGEMKALIESVPVGMRAKTNGGLIDTILTGAYRARASRILKDSLLTSKGCMPNSKIFKKNENNAKKLFANACPPLLFYSKSDMNIATQTAMESWGPVGSLDERAEAAIIKALRPVAEEWQNYGKFLVESATAYSKGDAKVYHRVMPIFAEADRAMKIAEGMAVNKCGAKSCADIGLPPAQDEWDDLLKEWLGDGKVTEVSASGRESSQVVDADGISSD